jgi:hypothetical protein
MSDYSDDDNDNKIYGRINTEITSPELCLVVFNQIKTICKSDPEEAHNLEDEITKKFIIDIVANKIDNLDTIREVASIIRKINNHKYTRWYA